MATDYTLPAVMEKRTRFFDGQFLVDQDFVDEQKYHLDRQRRHQRLLHVSGVCEGLEVRATALNTASVGPGTAVDADGRTLALAAAVSVDLPGATFNSKSGVTVYLTYQEVDTDQQKGQGSADNTRWLERPVVVRLLPGEPWTGSTPLVTLAQLALDGRGAVTVDLANRQYAGARLPGPAADPAALRSVASGAAALQGTLSVTGHVGVGTSTPENAEGWGRVLDVLGDAHAKLSVRTHVGKIDARVMAHDTGIYGSAAGMLVGTRSAHPLSLVTGGATRLTVSPGGRVGIGTDPKSEPKHELTVNGRMALENGVIQRGGTAITTTSDLGLYSQLDGQYIRVVTNKAPIRFYTDSGVGTAVRLTVEADGDVGVGVDAPAGRVDVSGVGDKADQPSLLLRAGNSAAKYEALQLAFSYNGGAQYRHGVRTRHNGGGVQGNALDFYVWSNAGKPDDAPSTHVMSLDGGHVGIGTTSPDNSEGWHRVVDVVGERHGKLSLRTTNLKLDGRVMLTEDGVFGTPSGMVVGTKTNHPLSLASAGATRMTFTADGHVGIGTTTVDNAELWARILDLYSRFNFRVNLRTDRVQARLMAHDDGIWNAMPGFVVGTKTEHALGLATNGATRLTVSPDGQIGIGTNRPENRDGAGQLVDVFGKVTTQLTTRTERVDGRLMVSDNAVMNAAAGMVLGTRSPHPLTLVTGGRPKLQLQQDGGINLPESGVIARGATDRLGTMDLGLYSQVQGNWVRIVSNGGPIAFFTDGGVGRAPLLTINQNGQVVVQASLFVAGALNYFWGPDGVWKNVQNRGGEYAGSYTTGGPSDARLKTAVRPLRDALGSVLRLTGLRYRWGDAGLDHLTRDVADTVSAGPGATEDDDRRVREEAVARARSTLAGDDIGLLAQDVERVVPEVVRDGPDGYKHIRYQQLTALLIEAVKEQQGTIDRLATRLDALAAGKER